MPADHGARAAGYTDWSRRYHRSTTLNLLVPLQHGGVPRDDGDTRAISFEKTLNMLCYINLGLVDGSEEAIFRFGLRLVSYLKYLEPVLSYGDAHALQELMVEVFDIVFLELVGGQEKRVVIDEEWVKGGFG